MWQKTRPRTAGRLALCAWAALVFSRGPASADEKRQPPVSDKEITRLVLQLGDDHFATREKAQRALLQIGKPALEALRKAMASTTDAELRRRAIEIMREIDPGGERRAQMEAKR